MNEQIDFFSPKIKYKVKNLPITLFQRKDDSLVLDYTYKQEDTNITIRITVPEYYFEGKKRIDISNHFHLYYKAEQLQIIAMSTYSKMRKYENSEEYIFYNGDKNDVKFSFKFYGNISSYMQSVESEEKKAKETKSKKKKKKTSMTPLEWYAAHPFQGGGFNPR